MFEIIGCEDDKNKVLVQIDMPTLCNLVTGFGCSNLTERKNSADRRLRLNSSSIMNNYETYYEIEDKLNDYIEQNDL